MFNLGAIEVLAICAILGGILGIYFRDKSKSKWIGILLGVIGACITSVIFIKYVFTGFIAIPLYSLIGSWLFNFGFKKISS